MATTKIYEQPQPQWPFAPKPLPIIEEQSDPPVAPYPDTFQSVAHSATQAAPSLEAFLCSKYVIYGSNQVIYYN